MNLTGSSSIDNGTATSDTALTGVFPLHRASLTVEAALALPVFVFAMLSMTFLLRVFYTQEIISHCLVNAVNEIALDCYGLSKSRAVDDFLVATGAVPDSFYTDPDMSSTLVSGLSANNAYDLLAEYNQTVNKRNLSDDDLNGLLSAGLALYGFTRDPDAVSDPLADIGWKGTFSWYLYKNIAAFGGGKEPGKTDESIADELLKRLNIIYGIDGLDFSGSQIMDGTDILVSVTYDVKIPVPLSPVEKITLNQRAMARMWGMGD
ncbi:MAG: pilus assembly protein [Clostridiales bacterium]|jgi:hypothetical protein|nr:pilus assembly protein [Clostridiales bacterium]